MNQFHNYDAEAKYFLLFTEEKQSSSHFKKGKDQKVLGQWTHFSNKMEPMTTARVKFLSHRSLYDEILQVRYERYVQITSSRDKVSVRYKEINQKGKHPTLGHERQSASRDTTRRKIGEIKDILMWTCVNMDNKISLRA